MDDVVERRRMRSINGPALLAFVVWRAGLARAVGVHGPRVIKRGTAETVAAPARPGRSLGEI
jgi:hypothetical protein